MFTNIKNSIHDDEFLNEIQNIVKYEQKTKYPNNITRLFDLDCNFDNFEYNNINFDINSIYYFLLKDETLYKFCYKTSDIIDKNTIEKVYYLIF